MSNILPDEVQVLCPHCGSLSPKKTVVCDCGYRLRTSPAAYAVLALVCVAVALCAVVGAYFLGRSSSSKAAELQIASLTAAHQQEISEQAAEYEQLLSAAAAQKVPDSDDTSAKTFEEGFECGYIRACEDAGIDAPDAGAFYYLYLASQYD